MNLWNKKYHSFDDVCTHCSRLLYNLNLYDTIDFFFFVYKNDFKGTVTFHVIIALKERRKIYGVGFFFLSSLYMLSFLLIMFNSSIMIMASPTKPRFW